MFLSIYRYLQRANVSSIMPKPTVSVSANLSSLERSHHILMKARRPKELPTARTTRRARGVGLWYEATPTRVSRRSISRAGGVARACRRGAQRERRGDKERRMIGS